MAFPIQEIWDRRVAIHDCSTTDDSSGLELTRTAVQSYLRDTLLGSHILVRDWKTGQCSAGLLVVAAPPSALMLLSGLLWRNTQISILNDQHSDCQKANKH